LKRPCQHVMNQLLESHKNYNPRLRLFYGVVVVLILVLLGGLTYRQLIIGTLYSDREELQNLRRILVPGPRGNIFDRNGELLVGNRPRFAAVVYLAELRQEFRQEFRDLRRPYIEQDIPTTGIPLPSMARAAVVQRYLDQINELLGRDEQVDSRLLERHLRQQLILPFFLVNDLSPEEYARLLEQVPIGSPIQVYSSSVRHYPHGSAAAHVLGYVGSTLEIPEEGVPGERLMTFNIRGSIGRDGLERSMDDRIQGQTGGEIWVVDPDGFQFKRIERKRSVQGEDVVSSLDIRLQKRMEDLLGSYTATAVALDPRNGEVLALATSPGYDLNDFTPSLPGTVVTEITETQAWTNRALQGLYPPGSTFKMITAMAALRSGVVDARTTSFCRGSHQVSGRTFHCHNRAGHGEVDLVRALSVSCNVYFYEHGVSAGIESIAAEARRFGLHEQTGIELPFEARAMLVGTPEWKRRVHGTAWFPGDTANVSIGQGDVRSTPLQMAVMTAALATRRESVRPTILLNGNRNRTHGFRPLEIEDAHYELIIRGMIDAVESGTARSVRLPGVSIAGKTGTAQVPTREGRLNMAWFVGFAPVENPEIAIAVLVEGTDPNDNFAGGSTAGPIAREVFREYFSNREPEPLAQSQR
jgi:penicillin-binding protein 2